MCNRRKRVTGLCAPAEAEFLVGLSLPANRVKNVFEVFSSLPCGQDGGW